MKDGKIEDEKKLTFICSGKKKELGKRYVKG